MPFKTPSTSTRSRRFGLAAFAVLLSVQCGGEKTGPPPTPSVIEKAGGDGQVAPVNDPLPVPLVVVVRDAAGDPVEGVSVQWDAPAFPAAATRGHFLVFILNRNGVPSKGKIIRLQ